MPHIALDSGYRNARIALATQHDKARAMAPAFSTHLGAQLIVADVDTDRLGTFTGERARPDTAPRVCERKARLGMAALGLPIGIASEGSFGPHPAAPFLAAGVEWMSFVDDTRQLVLTEERLSEETNYAQCTVRAGEDVDAWLARVRFPSHAVIVRPADLRPDELPASLLAKGITDRTAVAEAITRAVTASPSGRAIVETDMRAHLNPTRMANIAVLAEQLAQRLARPCPQCTTPGWGRVGLVPGLPCAWCGLATALVRAERWGCATCAHEEQHPRRDGRETADPGECERCNP